MRTPESLKEPKGRGCISAFRVLITVDVKVTIVFRGVNLSFAVTSDLGCH